MSSKSRRQRAPQHDARRGGGVVVAYVHPGEVSAFFLESMLTTVLADIAADAAGAHPRRIVNIMQEWSSANVSGSRNTVTARFLDQPAGEWLLWVDADMHWSPDALEQLLAAADPVQRPIVGGLCFGMADGRLWPTIYRWVETPKGITTVRLGDYPRDAVIPVAATGAAFLLIHRTVLEAVRDRGFSRAFPWFQETEHLGDVVGEDLTFCIRAAQCGYPTHVHTGVRVGHHKSQLLTEELFDEQQQRGEAGDVVAGDS